MSTPVKERATARSGAAGPGAVATAIPAQRQRRAPGATGAASRAYARRDERLGRLVGGRLGDRLGRAAAVPGRTPFALLVMGLLTVGLVATLWLSTAAAADSYRLTDARATATALREQGERLHRDVANEEAAPAIIARAQSLGMVPVADPPRLVVAPDGTSTVVGTPHAVTRPAPIVAPVVDPAVPQAPPAEAESQVGDAPDGLPTGTPTAGTPTAGTPTAGTPTSTGPVPTAGPAPAARATGTG